MGRAYRLFADLRGRWREILGESLFEVRYENLVQYPKGEIERILEHCGMPFYPACAAPEGAGGMARNRVRRAGKEVHYHGFGRPLARVGGSSRSHDRGHGRHDVDQSARCKGQVIRNPV